MKNAMLVEVVGRFVLLGFLGAVLLYGSYRVPDMDFHPAVHPRIVAWTVGGLSAMVAMVVSIALISPNGLDSPLFSFSLTMGIGSVAGFGAGIYEGKARTRERELEETVAQLQTSNERLEQFAYAASHDLQEPLRMVSSYLQLLENRYADELDEDAEEYIEFAVEGADRMRRMVDSLLEYSRVTRGDPLEPTDSGAVFDGVLDDLQLRIEEVDATITTDDLPTVTADPDQLSQVFRNLISNAIIYSGDAAPQVHVGAEPVDGKWEFSVADEGIGIDPEFHDRIFNVFERVHTETESAETGAGGIGLALCERIIERHGGEIRVESEPGEGATFYFTIPGAEPTEAQDRGTQSPVERAP